MRARRSAVVACVAIALVLASSSAGASTRVAKGGESAESTPCDVIRALSASQIFPDGLSGVALDVTWAEGLCAASPQSLDYESAWTALPSDAIVFTALSRASQLSVAGLEVHRSLRARVDVDAVYVDVAIGLRGRVSGTAGGVAFDAPFVATMSLRTGGFSSEVSCHAVYPWTGSLLSSLSDDATATAVVVDADLFDGTPAQLVVSAAQSAQNAQRNGLVALIASHFGRLRLRLDGIAAATTSLSASVRGAFLDAASLGDVDAASAFSGRLWDNAASTLSSTGEFVVLLPRSEVGVEEDAATRDAVHAIASASAGVYCDSVQVVAEAIQRSIGATIFVESDAFRVLSVSASTSAVVTCIRGDVAVGALSLSLSTAQPYAPRTAALSWPPRFPTSIFTGDARAAIHMTKGAPMQCRGSLWGYAKVPSPTGGDDVVVTATRGDLFGDEHAGRLVADILLSEASAVAAVNAAFGQAAQAVSFVGPLASIAARIPTDISPLLSKLGNRCTAPTLVRFIDWAHSELAPLRVTLPTPSEVSGSSLVNLTFSLSASMRTQPVSTADFQWIQARLSSRLDDLYARFEKMWGPAVRPWARPSLDATVKVSSASVSGIANAGLSVLLDVHAGTSTPHSDGASVVTRTLATLAVTFPRATGLFGSALFVYDSNADSLSVAADLSLSARETFPEYAWRALLTGDVLSLNRRVSVALLVDAARSALTTARSVSWLGQTLQPTSLVSGSAADGVDFAHMWANVIDAFEQLRGAVGTVDVHSALSRVMSSINANGHFAACAWSVADVNSGRSEAAVALAFNFSASHVQPFVVNDDGWPMLATSRFRGNAVMVSSLAFVLSGQDVSAFEMSAQSRARLTGWSAPFRHDMLSGHVEAGSLSVSVALDTRDASSATSYATLDVDARVVLDEADGSTQSLQLSVSGLGLAADANADTLDFSRGPRVEIKTDSSFRIATGVLVAALREAIVRAPSKLSSGAFGVPVAPLLPASLEKVVQSWDGMADTSILPWMSSISIDGGPYLVQSDVCVGSLALPARVSFSINGGAFSFACDVPALPTSSLTSFVDSLHTVLSGCVGTEFFSVGVVSVQKDKTDCGSFGLIPTIPGAVWRMDVTNSQPTGTATVFPSRTWTLATFASFTHWSDLAVAATALFGSGGRLRPWLSSVVSANYVPEELRSVFPASLNLVGIDIEFSKEHDFVPDALESAVSKFSVTGDKWSTFNFEGSALARASLACNVSAGIGAVFGVAPAARLSVTTNFDGVALLPSAVVADGQNTFDLTVYVEHRAPPSSNASTATPTVARVEWRQSIRLDTGVPVWDALLGSFPAQLSPEMSAVVSVSAVNGSTVRGLNPTAQVRIAVSRASGPNGTWILPYGISLSNSLVLALGNVTQMPTVPRTTVARMSISARVSASASASSASGHLGILDVTANDASVSGEVVATAGLRDAADANQVVVSMSDVGRLGNIFDYDWSVRAEARVAQLSFGAASLQVPVLEGLSFDVNASMTSPSAGDMLSASAGWALSIKHPIDSITKVYERFAALNYTTFCGWMDAAELVRTGMTGYPAANAPIPFLSKAVADISQDGIGRIMQDARARACDLHQSWTVTLLCAVLDAELGAGACESIEMGETALTVVVTANTARSYADRFRLDFAWMGLGHDIPLGLGFPGSVSINGTFSLRLALTADWSNGGIHLHAAPGSFVRASVAAEMLGAVELAIGPVSSRFGNLNAAIGRGAPAFLEARIGDDGGVAVQLSGSARMSGSLTALSEPVCDLRISVALADALDPSAWHVTTYCDPDFVGAWERVMERFGSALLNYFKNAMVVMSQLQDGFDEFMQTLLVAVPSWIVPIVDRAIADAIPAKLESIIGHDARQGIITELTEFTNSLIMNHTGVIDYGLLDQILVDGFTFILCKHLKPDTCPPAPDASKDELTWPLTWTDTLRPPVPAVHFGLGGGGFAQLDFNCDPKLTLDFTFRATLVLSKTKGISLRFDNNPVLHSGIAFALGGDCGLEGRLGFVSAILAPDTSSGVSGALTVTHVSDKWSADFAVDAVLRGELDIGLAGKLKGVLSEDVEALQTLPYVKVASMDIEWHWNLTHPSVVPPTIKFGGVSFCVGSFVSRMLSSVKKKLEILLNPLDKVIGPNSLLMSHVGEPAKVLFGRDMTLLEFLMEVEKTQCEESCMFDGVFEALEALSSVEKILAKIDALMGLADCMSWSQIKSFHFDPSVADPAPVPDGPEPANGFPALSFAPDADPVHVERVTEVWADVTRDDKDSGLKFLLKAKDIPKYILDLIMGKPFDICELRLKPFRISIGMVTWQVVVWPVPTVWLGVSVSAQLVLTPPTIVYTSRGISKFISSHRPADMAAGFGMRARNDDGSPYWPLQATVRVGGFVGVGFGWGPAWVEGDAELFLEAVGKLGLVTAYSDSVVYFDQLFWIIKKNGGLGALALEFDLNGGVEVRLRACVSVAFGRKCWTLASKEWKMNLFHIQSYNPAVPPPVCSDRGGLNLNLNSYSRRSIGDDVLPHTYGVARRAWDEFTDNSAWTYQLHEHDGLRTHGLLPPGDSASVSVPSNSRDVSAAMPITFEGSSGGERFSCRVLSRISQPVQFPANSAGSVHVNIDGDRSVGLLQLSPSLLKTSQADGASPQAPTSGSSVMFAGGAPIGQRCRTVLLDQPVGGMTVHVTGVPCTTMMKTDVTSLVRIRGAPADYASQPVHMGSALSVHVTVEATEYRMNDNTVTGDRGVLALNLEEPEGVTNMHVASHPVLPSLLVVESLPEYRVLEPRGGSGDDMFDIPDLITIAGYLNMSGAESRNTLNVTMYTPTTGLNASLTPAVVMMDASAKRRSATFSDIKRRFLTVFGKSDATSIVKVLGAEDLSHVRVRGIGDGNSTMVYPVTQCDPLARIDLDLQGGGEHTVLVGRDEAIRDVTCTIAVAGGVEEGQVNSIVIQSRNDGRPYQFTLHSDKLLVYDSVDTREFMTVYFENIHRFVFQFSNVSGVYSRVTVVTPTARTEMHFDFPAEPTNADWPNHITVCRSLASTVITGSFLETVVGPDQYDITCNTQRTSLEDDDVLAPNPLYDIHGSVYLVNTASGVTNASLHSYKSGNQGFVVGPSCIDPVENTGMTSPTRPPPVGPSEWLCSILQQHGVAAEHCYANCTVVYLGLMHVAVQTGAGADYMHGHDLLPSASFNIALGDGRDKIVWARSAADALLDLGSDSDQLIVEAPVYRTFAALGDDDVIDAIDVWCGASIPHVVNGVVWPLGADSSFVLSLGYYRVRDQLNVRAGLPLWSPENGAAFDIPIVVAAPVARPRVWSSAGHVAEQSRRLAEAQLPVGVTHDARSIRAGGRGVADDGSVVYVVMNVTGSVVRRDLVDNSTVVVLAMENQCVLSLNADVPQPGVVPPANWNVRVQLPALVVSNFIVVESTAASNGTVHVVVPATSTPASTHLRDSVYAIGIAASDPGDYLVWTAGGLTVKASNLPHLRTSLEHPSAIAVDHARSWPELVFDSAMPGSTVSVANTGASVFLSGVRAVLSGSLLTAAHTGGFVFGAAGLHTDVTVSASDAGVSLVHVVDDCVNLNFTTAGSPSRTVSPWLVDLGAAFGVRPGALRECSLALHNASRLAVVTHAINATNLDGLRNVGLLTCQSAMVALAETANPWSAVDISGNNVTIPGRFTVQVDPGAAVTAVAAFRPIAAPFSADCGDDSRDPATQWSFVDPSGSASSAAAITWTSRACRASIIVPDVGFAPAVTLHDSTLLSVGVHFQSDRAAAGAYRRTLLLSDTAFRATGMGEGIAKEGISLSSVDWAAECPLDIVLQDGANTLQLAAVARSSGANAGNVRVGGSVTAFTLDMPPMTGVEFPSSAVFMSPRTGALELQPSASTTCFDADRVCSAGFWIAAATLGSQVCFSAPALSECTREKTIALSVDSGAGSSFDAEFSCAASPASTVLRFGADAEPQPQHRYDLWVRLAFGLFFISAVCCVVVWVVTRQWVLFSWHILLVSASLWPVAMDATEPSDAAAIVLASQRAVFSLLSPWYCGGNSVADAAAATFGTAVSGFCVAAACVVAAVFAVEIAAKKVELPDRAKRVHAASTIVSTVLVAVYVFVFMPAHIFHLSRFGWTGIASVSVIAVVVVFAAFLRASLDVGDSGSSGVDRLQRTILPPVFAPRGLTPSRVNLALNAVAFVTACFVCMVSSTDLRETGAVSTTSLLGTVTFFYIVLHAVSIWNTLAWNANATPLASSGRSRVFAVLNIAVEVLVLVLGFAFIALVKGGSGSATPGRVWVTWQLVSLLWVLGQCGYAIHQRRRKQSGASDGTDGDRDARDPQAENRALLDMETMEL